MSDANGYRYVPNPSAREIVAHRLHDVQFFDQVGRFEFVDLRKDAGEIVGETSGFLRLPLISVEPGIMLTYERMPNGIVLPVLAQVTKRLIWRH